VRGIKQNLCLLDRIRVLTVVYNFVCFLFLILLDFFVLAENIDHILALILIASTIN